MGLWTLTLSAPSLCATLLGAHISMLAEQARVFSLSLYLLCAVLVFSLASCAKGAKSLAVVFPAAQGLNLPQALSLEALPTAPLHSLTLALLFWGLLLTLLRPPITLALFEAAPLPASALFILIGGIWVYFNGGVPALWSWDPIEVTAALALSSVLACSHAFTKLQKLTLLLVAPLAAVRLFRFNASLSAHHLSAPLFEAVVFLPGEGFKLPSLACTPPLKPQHFLAPLVCALAWLSLQAHRQGLKTAAALPRGLFFVSALFAFLLPQILFTLAALRLTALLTRPKALYRSSTVFPHAAVAVLVLSFGAAFFAPSAVWPKPCLAVALLLVYKKLPSNEL